MALVVVLSMLALVTIVGVAFTMFSMYESRNARNFLRAAQGDFLMNLAIGDAMHKIIAGTPQVGSNYYWVSAPGRIWRVGGVNTPGATNKLFSTNPFFMPSHSADLDELAEESGFIDLFSEADTADAFAASKVGFGPTNSYVNLNAPQRGYKIAPDPNPSGLGGGRIPLTVQWVNVARDMTKPAGPDNPIVGRYAYWVDVENARLNINDVGKLGRENWRGLNAAEFEIDGILSGVSATDLDVFRQPEMDMSSEAYLRNTNYFRRVEDLRLSGVSEANIKNNAFYLTAAGRDLEVDNGGRLPIQIDRYNGNTNATYAAFIGVSGSANRNHPLADWSSATDRPYLGTALFDPILGGGGTPPETNYVAFSGTDDIMSAAEQALWEARRDQMGSGGAENPYLPLVGDTEYYAVDITSDFIEDPFFGDTPGFVTYSQWQEQITLGTPGTLDFDWAANLNLMGTNTQLTNGTDWLPRRLINTNTTLNNFVYDQRAMQRLMRTNAPQWFIASSATATNNQGGKYTWNEIGQMFANMNTWRQTNLIEISKGDVQHEVVLGGYFQRDQVASTVPSHRPHGVGFGQRTTTITRGDRDYTVIPNQNVGYRPLPYVNEVGIGLVRGPHDFNANSLKATRMAGAYQNALSHISIFLELWNPTASTNTEPYNLGIYIIMPEIPTPLAKGNPFSWGPEVPEPIPFLGGNNTVANQNNGFLGASGGYGPPSNPERNRMAMLRPWASSSSVTNENTRGYKHDFSFPGAIWANPGASGPGAFGFSPYMRAQGWTGWPHFGQTAFYPLDTDFERGVTGMVNGYWSGGLMSGYNRTIIQPVKWNNRWHAPVLSQDVENSSTWLRCSQIAIIKDAHLIDWRVPQHIDISLLPKFEVNDHVVIGFSAIDTNGTMGVESDATINMAFAIGLMKLPTNLTAGIQTDRFHIFAGGAINTQSTNSQLTQIGTPDIDWGNPDRNPGYSAPTIDAQSIGVFYDMVPQPRINPRDENNALPGYGVGGTGLPQTKFLPFLNISLPYNGGYSEYFASREVDDPRVNDRMAFVDFSRDSAGAETGNLVNSYDANDWGPAQVGVGNTSLRVMDIVRDDRNSPYMYSATAAGSRGNFRNVDDWAFRQHEQAPSGSSLISRNVSSGLSSNPAGSNAGEVGAINRLLTNNIPSVWKDAGQGTNWAASVLTTAKPPFTGWGDGDGDLTSHVMKENSYEHPAELGYVHTGRPWRTLRFGRTHYGTNETLNVKTIGSLSVTNTLDTVNTVPDWYLFDQFLSVGARTIGADVLRFKAPDAVAQAWTMIQTNKVVGQITNPRRATMALNPAIYTAEHTNGVPAEMSRLKPLYAMFSGVVDATTLTNLVQAFYQPGTTNVTGYEGYQPGATGDRFGIPGIIDSPGELAEVFGRMTNGTVIASAPYTMMVTNLWSGTSLNAHTNLHSGVASVTASGVRGVMSQGWSGVGYDGGAGAVTLSVTNNAATKELLRAIGAMVSPRSSHFRIYVCVQTISDQDGTLNVNDRVTSEKWMEILVERDNNYQESIAENLSYKIIWEKPL